MRSYPELPLTTDAIYDFSVNGYRRHGVHDSSVTRVAKTGRTVHERTYDPIKDNKVLPNPLSVSKILYGGDFLKVRHPRTNLSMNVVVHADPSDRSFAPWITAAKDRTMETLAGSLASVRAGRGDRTNIYVVGDAQRLDTSWVKDEAYEVIESESISEISKEVEEICFDGLTFVLSSFKGIAIGADRHQATGIQPPIGIKVNHLFELELQPGTGIFATGESENPFINTNDQVQLGEWNKVLAFRNSGVDSYLGSKGLSLAQVTFEGRQTDPVYGFNVPLADAAIALTIPVE